jgi:hypothetical protein
MWKDTNALTGDTRRRQLILFASIACLGSIAYSLSAALLALNHVLTTGLVGDVFAYAEIADAVFEGGIPYIDTRVEHLPVALVPVLTLQAASRITGVPIWLVWPGAMSALFIASTVYVDRFDAERPAGFIYIAVAMPLLPLALFRIEPWIVLLTAMAIASFLKNRTVQGAALTIAATLGKGWPIVVALLPWKRGRRAAALVSVGVSIAALVVVASQEGFQAGREFDGIHTETLIGSTVVLWRHLMGDPLQIFSVAGARYVAAPDWSVAVNAIAGLIAAGVAVVVARRKLDDRRIISLIGFSILAIILVSPLFSTQFIFWLAPFVAGTAVVNRKLYVAGALFALASITIFHDKTLLWSVEVFAVNVLMLALAFEWGRRLLASTHRSPNGQEPSTSFKNLPV